MSSSSLMENNQFKSKNNKVNINIIYMNRPNFNSNDKNGFIMNSHLRKIYRKEKLLNDWSPLISREIYPFKTSENSEKKKELELNYLLFNKFMAIRKYDYSTLNNESSFNPNKSRSYYYHSFRTNRTSNNLQKKMKKIRASKLKKLLRKKNEIFDKNLKHGKPSENNIKLKEGRDKAKNHLIFEKLYNNESNIETISKMSKMFLNKSKIKNIEKIYKTNTSRQKSPLKNAKNPVAFHHNKKKDPSELKTIRKTLPKKKNNLNGLKTNQGCSINSSYKNYNFKYVIQEKVIGRKSYKNSNNNLKDKIKQLNNQDLFKRNNKKNIKLIDNYNNKRMTTCSNNNKIFKTEENNQKNKKNKTKIKKIPKNENNKNNKEKKDSFMDKIELNSKIFMEKDDDKETDINYIKINEFNVKKPKEMNLKYTILKNGIQTEKSMEEISESKIIIGNIEGYKDIIESDKLNNNLIQKDKFINQKDFFNSDYNNINKGINKNSTLSLNLNDKKIEKNKMSNNIDILEIYNDNNNGFILNDSEIKSFLNYDKDGNDKAEPSITFRKLKEKYNNDNEILPLNAKKLSIEKKYGDITKNFQIKEKINCYSKKPNKLLSIDQMGNDNKKNYFDLEKKQSNNSKRENDIKYVSKFERNFDNQPDKNIIQNICNIHIEGNGNKCLIF